MAEGFEYNLSRRDAVILQWMHDVQKANSSDNIEESDRGLTFNPDTTRTHGSYPAITSSLHHSSSNTPPATTALPTPPTHHTHHHPHTSQIPVSISSLSSSPQFHNPPSSNLPLGNEPRTSQDPQPPLHQHTATNVSPEWNRQFPTSSGEPHVSSMEVNLASPDVGTTPFVKLLQQPKSTSPLPEPIQDVQLPSFNPLGRLDTSTNRKRRPKPLVHRFDTFTGSRSNSKFPRQVIRSHSHVTRQLSGSQSNVNQHSSISMKTSLSASNLEPLEPKSAPVSPNLVRKLNPTRKESMLTSQLPPPIDSSSMEGHHLGLSSCSSRKSYSHSDIRQLDLAMEQQYVTSPSPKSSVSSLAPNIGGDSIPSDSSSLDDVGVDDGRLKFQFGTDFDSQAYVDEVATCVESTMMLESGQISSGEAGLMSLNQGQQTGLTSFKHDGSNHPALSVQMELDSHQETGLTSSSPPQETGLTSTSSDKTGQAGGSSAEEELLEILKKWHREGKHDTEDLLYAMRLTGHRESADRLQLKEDLAGFRAEKHYVDTQIEDQSTSLPLPSNTSSRSTPFVRQRQLTRSPPSPSTPLSPKATPTPTNLFRQRSGSLGVVSGNSISRKRLASFDRSMMFSFDTSNEEKLVQPQHQPRFLKRSPPTSPGHPPSLLLSPPSHYQNPSSHTLHHSHRRSSSDIVPTDASHIPSKTQDSQPSTKLGNQTLHIGFPPSSKCIYLQRRGSSPLDFSTSTTTTATMLQGSQAQDKAPLAHKPSPVGLSSTQLRSLPEKHPLNVSRSPSSPVSSTPTSTSGGSIVVLVEQLKLEGEGGSSRKRQTSAVTGTSTSLSFPPARKRSVNRQDSGIGTLSEPSVKY